MHMIAFLWKDVYFDIIVEKQRLPNKSFPKFLNITFLKLNCTAIPLKSLRKRDAYCQLRAQLWTKRRLCAKWGQIFPIEWLATWNWFEPRVVRIIRREIKSVGSCFFTAKKQDTGIANGITCSIARTLCGKIKGQPKVEFFVSYILMWSVYLLWR